MAAGAALNWCPDRADIIYIQHSPHAGKEMPGMHPMLVSSPLAFQPKSFDWRERKAGPHPWGGGHHAILAAALAKLDTICGISQT